LEEVRQKKEKKASYPDVCSLFQWSSLGPVSSSPSERGDFPRNFVPTLTGFFAPLENVSFLEALGGLW
jgi:hypothetical protein